MTDITCRDFVKVGATGTASLILARNHAAAEASFFKSGATGFGSGHH
jgi:hypothetical protein